MKDKKEKWCEVWRKGKQKKGNGKEGKEKRKGMG